MADALMAALQSKLAAYESAGMTDHAKRVKARIAELEKGPGSKSEAFRLKVQTEAAAVKTAAPIAAKKATRQTVKKAVKKTARKKN